MPTFVAMILPVRLRSGAPGRLGRLARRVAVVAIAVIACSSATVDAQAGPAQTPIDPDAIALAERFAPIIMLKQQEEPCDTEGEPFVPMPVDLVLDNPEIALRQMGIDNPTVMRSPGAGDLYELGEGFFLDFPGSSLTPGCIYERDFDKYFASSTATVYAHVVQQPDEPELVFVQYWFYWYYNDWNNKHESDWEGITLKFEASSVSEALQGQPVAVGFSQHEGGERADWDDPKLGREGDHPIVYSSARSHASYFGSALYLGRGASEGFGCDDTSGPSERVSPDVIVLPDSVDDPTDPLAWLEYRGRWGERQTKSFNGPTGPAAKARWLEPAPWFDDLRPSSVVIPAGDSDAASVIDVFCAAVERGSTALVNLSTSPERVIVILLVLTVLARFLMGRTDWSRVETSPVVRRRKAGQIIRAAFIMYRKSPLVYIMFGLVYIPAAIVTGALSALAQLVPFVSSLIGLAGNTSGTSIILAALVGSIANVAAFVIISGIVAEYLDGPERGTSAAMEAIEATWHRRRELLRAFLRSFVIVFVLLVSLIGAPWGIRQLVRYQFVPQAVTYDDLAGQRALDRSSDLVRGRWFHTALVAAIVNGFVGLTALFVALLLLVVATGIPLWVFSALATLVYALTVPLAAIAMTLLYGNAIAAREQHDASDPAADSAVADAPIARS
jgi:hypothetical protein